MARTYKVTRKDELQKRQNGLGLQHDILRAGLASFLGHSQEAIFAIDRAFARTIRLLERPAIAEGDCDHPNYAATMIVVEIAMGIFHKFDLLENQAQFVNRACGALADWYECPGSHPPRNILDDIETHVSGVLCW